MLDIIESLMKGENSYPRAFAAAQAFWADFYAQHQGDDDRALRKAIDHAQIQFQWEMENKAGLTPPFAKGIMPLTAIGALYRDGFEDPDFAKRVVQAFVSSTTLSLEVKSEAEKAAKMYFLG